MGWYSGQIPNQGDDRSTFFSWFEIGLKFSVPFSAVTLSKYSKYSFFFGVDFNLAYTDYPRHLESKVPLPSSTSKAKKLFPTASEGVYKGNIEKQGCFYRDGSIF